MLEYRTSPLHTLSLASHILITAANMVFTSPKWVPQLPFDPPDSIPICDFMLTENYGRHPLGYSRPPFTCGLSGAEYSALDVCDRVESLARGLAKELGWHPNEGTEWDKVIGVFTLNTVRSVEYIYVTVQKLLTEQSSAGVGRHVDARVGDSSSFWHILAGERSLFGSGA